jgi:RNA polymerase sigma-70 factor (ECF subfamily)
MVIGCAAAEKVAEGTIANDVYSGIVTFMNGNHLMINPLQSEFSLEALRAGDHAEFARLVDAYSGPIYRLGLRILGNVQDAEDVLQNTFLNALVHLPDFEGRSSISTWLYRIAANEALMLIRRRKPEVNIDDEQIGDSDAPLRPTQFVDWSALPEEELLSEEVTKALDAAIQLLPETLRMVFALRDVEGLSIKETADVLDLTETNVKTRLLRARLFLRERLSAYYGEHIIREDKNDKS